MAIHVAIRLVGFPTCIAFLGETILSNQPTDQTNPINWPSQSNQSFKKTTQSKILNFFA